MCLLFACNVFLRDGSSQTAVLLAQNGPAQLLPRCNTYALWLAFTCQQPARVQPSRGDRE